MQVKGIKGWDSFGTEKADGALKWITLSQKEHPGELELPRRGRTWQHSLQKGSETQKGTKVTFVPTKYLKGHFQNLVEGEQNFKILKKGQK